MPRHWNNDHDSKDFGASLGLIGSVVLIVFGLGLALLGLLA